MACSEGATLLSRMTWKASWCRCGSVTRIPSGAGVLLGVATYDLVEDQGEARDEVRASHQHVEVGAVLVPDHLVPVNADGP